MFTYQNQSYDSFIDFCNKSNISYYKVIRISREHDIDIPSALDLYLNDKSEVIHRMKKLPKSRNKPIAVDYQGKHYYSQKDACEDLGIDYVDFLYFKRHHNKMSICEILDTILETNFKI